MKLPKLYKYTSKGQVQEWQIITTDNMFSTMEGIKGGKITTSLPTVCEGKNIGRSNETTPQEQAETEAKAKWQKKIDSGYNEILSRDKKFFEPMLAKDAKESKDLDFKKRTFVQPKLDGLRCINQDNILMSRNGKPFTSCQHLAQSGPILDGELYTHEYKHDFNKIVSLCKKKDPTKEETQEIIRKIEYWIYDFPSHKGPFSERYEKLIDYLTYHNEAEVGFVLVPAYEVFSWDDIKKYHEQFLSEGYEGTIIRIDIGEYENKRSKQLLKYKDFVDEEFEIVGAVEGQGNRTGTVGKFTMKMKDGRTFGSNIKGNFEYLTFLWENHKKYVGKKATVKYFALTPDGIPRFPYIIKIDRDEYE